MLESIIPDGVDVDRIARIYVSMKRRRLAEVIAEGSDDMTQVKARDKIIEMEDIVLDEIEGDCPDVAEPALRAMAQHAIIGKLDEGVDDGKKEHQ